MDLTGPQLISNILTNEELDQTPPQVQEKLKTWLDGFFDEYCKNKAAAHRLHDYEEKSEELQALIQDYEVKLDSQNKNVEELRAQLDSVSKERVQLLEQCSIHETQMVSLRNERNSVAEERDSLLKLIERQKSELDRLQEEIHSYQQQLKNAITAKCEAIARVDDIESQKVALDFKERRMEQERTMLHNQIRTLTDDLNRNIAELQNIRRENTMQGMHLETKLVEKSEELKIVQGQCTQYKETIDRLTQNLQDLSTKMLNQNEETNKMMDVYKKELEAKSKLAELYKGNCEDTDAERNELSIAITDLKRMLAEASEQYGELETKFKATVLRHEQELEERDKIIESQKSELQHANDLLKEVQNETMESAISKMAPSAAVASRLIRSDMSLTELYSLYVKSSEELDLQKRENARLNLQLKTILQELSENAPVIKKQEIEYEKLIETNNILAHQRDELLNKKSEMEELMNNAHSKINHLERDNKKLKNSQNDLSRQVCYLLKEVEQLRIGIISDSSTVHSGNMSTTDDVISKKLVTFSNIIELQENNQKLLLLVRDLSTKLEEAETLKQQIDAAAYQEKIESYAKKIQSVQDTLNQQNNTVATLVSKCERYKKMYFQLQKNLHKSATPHDVSDVEDIEMVDADDSEKKNITNSSNQSKQRMTESETERRVRDLEQQLQDMKDQYKTLKEQYEYYTQEKKNNERIMNEQFDSMRTEVRELTSTNCKLMSSLEYTKEQIKLQQKNIATYKQQITALEDRTKNYENTIIKHEQTVHYLKDEVMKAQHGHSAAQSEASHLRGENRILKDTVNRLQAEKEGYHRDQQNQNLLLNNLEMIKSNLERSELEGRARLEQRLDETVRELSAQRRRFQEEEDRFREFTADLKRQAESAKKSMEEERAQSEILRKELKHVRDELTMKTNKIDELSKKLQDSLTPSKNDNPIALANKKTREIEVKLEEAKIEVNSLTNELAKAREHADQYFKMSQSAEAEIKNLHEIHTNYTAQAEAEIKELKLTELNLKSRISELEAEVQLGTVTEIPSTNQSDQLKKSKDELKDVLQKLSECNRNIRALRTENTTLSESLNTVQGKYANEMVLHSADIQELTKVKAEMTKIQDKISELSAERDSAKNLYDELKKSYDESLLMLQNEKDELERRIIDLNGLNSSLHDQIEALTMKLNILSQTQPPNIGTNSINDSAAMDTSATELNRSRLEDDDRNHDQLLQIIKYLRKEKDLIDAKLDILKAENTRLQSENMMLQKKLDALKGSLNQERTKSDTLVVSASKHEEILRKIENLNAMTDSNRILREERNSLAARVKELNEHINSIENDLLPLQTQNRELSTKIEELTSENTSLRTEAIKWRQRANVLVEKSNKNPEEFKRLQTERENLAKMLTHEKEMLNQTTDELNTIKAEKLQRESEITALEKQIQNLSEEKKKLADDYTGVRQSNTRMLQEIMELRNKLLQKEESLQKLTEEIESKEAQLQDSKNKEFQIRKIAKRYKDSYLELSNKTAAASAEGAATSQDNMELGGNSGTENAAGAVAAAAAVTNELEQLRNTIENLNGVIRTTQEESEKLRKDYDDLKTAVEIDDRTKTLLREAKARIVSLTESKNAISQELNTTKSKLQSMLQSSETADSTINIIKTQYEETLTRLEKEMLEQANQNKETISRLTRENESLLMRINQLNRQLGLQQSAKPSTSSVAITDKGCISESSPRTANVKPMSGSTTVQQSATVTPWRGIETPLASIRPISVQNSRTAAILPTSQQPAAGGSSTSTSTSSTSSTTTVSTGSSSNTALVPPQQQVHTTGSSSIESMSSSPTSSHTDYMPSTSSSASVAVAAIPPMGSTSAAESSQEAESVQQPQQNESQLPVGGGQQQVVALVSPRVEASSQNVPSPNIQLQQDPSNQQPSTSGTTSSSTYIAVSSQSRHTPSSSNVTTSQAGTSGGQKRPRELEGDLSNNVEDGNADKAPIKHPKRLRGSEPAILGVTESGVDVEYQVPTSSQRDQEDDIVVVDSEEEDDGMIEADDGPTDVDAEHEGYEDSYEQDQDMDENDIPEVNESNIQADAEVDNNEVDVDEDVENQAQCTSGTDSQKDGLYNNGASTSQSAAAALANCHEMDSHQQIQTISSGSYDSTNSNVSQPCANQWKQSRLPKPNVMTPQEEVGAISGNVSESGGNRGEQDPSGSRPLDCGTELVSSPQGSKFVAVNETVKHSELHNTKGTMNDTESENVVESEEHMDKRNNENSPDAQKSGGANDTALVAEEDMENVEEEFTEESDVVEIPENVDSESHHSSGATQSEMQDIQQNQVEATSEENEGIDGVSSEGEKQAVEDIEEEGREAEASTSPSVTTRSKAIKGTGNVRRPSRGFQRGGRPTPIIWQDGAGHSRNLSPNQRGQQESPGSPMRGFPNQRSQRARRMRRPTGGNYGNMRYS